MTEKVFNASKNSQHSVLYDAAERKYAVKAHSPKRDYPNEGRISDLRNDKLIECQYTTKVIKDGNGWKYEKIPIPVGDSIDKHSIDELIMALSKDRLKSYSKNKVIQLIRKTCYESGDDIKDIFYPL